MSEPVFRLQLVRVFVRDFERALRFYGETLGMTLKLRSDAFGWAQFEAGGADLAIEREQLEPGEESTVGRFLGVSLAVKDIYAVHQQLVARGVEFVGAPEKMSWGGVLAHLRDPDGNVLTLVGEPR